MTFGEMLAKQLKGEASYTDEEFAAQAKKQMPSMTRFNGIDTTEHCRACGHRAARHDASGCHAADYDDTSRECSCIGLDY